MKEKIARLPLFKNRKEILQGTTTVSLGDFNYFYPALSTAKKCFAIRKGVVHGSDQDSVLKSIRNLKEYLHLKNTPLVLAQQVHGTKIASVRRRPLKPVSFYRQTDALITNQRHILIGILTADCAPVFFYDPRRQVIALVHAGWRGVAKGIVPKCVKVMKEYYCSAAADILAGIGPYISRQHYEIDRATAAALGMRAKGKAKVDLGELIIQQLLEMNVLEKNIAKGCFRTYNCPLFFSYRKHHEKAGRMLSFLLIK